MHNYVRDRAFIDGRVKIAHHQEDSEEKIYKKLKKSCFSKNGKKVN